LKPDIEVGRRQPGTLEALIPEEMQSHACAAEVPDERRERTVKIVLEIRQREGKATVSWAGASAKRGIQARPESAGCSG
jgi:hypothetical protein